mgnify:CR=1 FL=1
MIFKEEQEIFDGVGFTSCVKSVLVTTVFDIRTRSEEPVLGLINELKGRKLLHEKPKLQPCMKSGKIS